MIIVGGTFPLNPQACDTISAFGTHNLNLGGNGPSKSMWDWFYHNITTYQVPQVITSKIGGGYVHSRVESQTITDEVSQVSRWSNIDQTPIRLGQ